MARKKEQAFETEQYPFPTRLRTLMEERKVTQRALALAIGVRPQTVSLYANGQSSPDVDKITKIADFFEVSADYLLGRTDIESPKADVQSICKQTGLSEDAVSVLCEESPGQMRFTLTLIDNLLRERYSYESASRVAAQFLAIAEMAPPKDAKQTFADHFLSLLNSADIFSEQMDQFVEIPVDIASDVYRDIATKAIGDIIEKSIKEYAKPLTISAMEIQNLTDDEKKEFRETLNLAKKAGVLAAFAAFNHLLEEDNKNGVDQEDGD